MCTSNNFEKLLHPHQSAELSASLTILGVFYQQKGSRKKR